MNPTPDQEIVLQAFADVVRPLLRLAIARGVSYNLLDEQLRKTLVQEAQTHHHDVPAHGIISRISTTSGLNRREVTRLVKSGQVSRPRNKWLAGEVFTRWVGDAGYQDASGKPLALPRQGPAPSFESLAQSVTRDLHPRSLLEELQRLDMVRLDELADIVRIERNAFVPNGDFAGLMAFLSDNVGDHLKAAVQNVLQQPAPHFEQAIYADELSLASIQAFRGDVAQQWQQLLAALIPRLTELVEHDQSAPEAANQRVRVGFYAYHENMTSRQDSRTDEGGSTADQAPALNNLDQGKDE